MKITRLETFLVKPRYLFLKVHADDGPVGLGEPILESRGARPLLTSALSGVEQALWDLGGKAAGMPVYQMLGGSHARPRPHVLRRGWPHPAAGGHIGAGADRGHARRRRRRVRHRRRLPRAIEPPAAALLIKTLEPPSRCSSRSRSRARTSRGLRPWPADPHPDRHGERVFTKWASRELLGKRACTIVQPDISHAVGIFEGRLIPGIAESYYASVAPHGPLGPVASAACIQLGRLHPVLPRRAHGAGAGHRAGRRRHGGQDRLQ